MYIEESYSIEELDHLPMVEFNTDSPEYDDKYSLSVSLPKQQNKIQLKLQYEKGPLNKRMKRSLAMISLEGFISTRTKRMVRKDYVIVLAIRGYRRLVLEIFGTPHSNRPLLQIATTEEAQEMLEIFIETCRQGEVNLKTIPTNQGDGNRREFNGQKCCNKAFLKGFFEDEFIKKSYYYYIQLLFIDASPKELREKFKVKCCRDDRHYDCDEKWNQLKQFLEFRYLAEYGIPTWHPNNN